MIKEFDLAEQLPIRQLSVDQKAGEGSELVLKHGKKMYDKAGMSIKKFSHILARQLSPFQPANLVMIRRILQNDAPKTNFSQLKQAKIYKL